MTKAEDYRQAEIERCIVFLRELGYDAMASRLQAFLDEGDALRALIAAITTYRCSKDRAENIEYYQEELDNTMDVWWKDWFSSLVSDAKNETPEVHRVALEKEMERLSNQEIKEKLI